ncbi:MAG: SET domain-containing protein [Desulfuromonas sp.]
MIHPATRIGFVSEAIGNGVFATAPLPCGTLLVVQDAFDQCLTRAHFQALPPVLRDSLETYLYHNKRGELVLGWDHAKYINHSCTSNSLMTDYGLEIVVRDIAAGEEITTDYGLLNVQEPYELYCNCQPCRGRLALDDIDRLADLWDQQIRDALQQAPRLQQPLWPLVSAATLAALSRLSSDPASYRSVRGLKWRCDAAVVDRIAAD